MHYLDLGKGHPLLLVHGSPTWSFLFRKMVPGLVSAGFRCVVPDLLGYGLSDHPRVDGVGPERQAGALLQLIEELALNDMIVVGQDWGGPIGLGAAVQVPERVAGVVVGSTFAWRTSGLVRLVGRALRSGVAQRWMGGEGFVPRMIGALAHAKLSDTEMEHYTAVVSTPELRRSLSRLPRELLDADTWLEKLERDVRDKLGSKPALLLHGAREGALGLQALRRFETLFVDHKLVSLPDAGHFFQEDSPRETVAAIVAWFA